MDAKASDSSTTAATPAARHGHNIWKAIGWSAMSLVCFTLVAIAGREAGKQMSSIHMVFYRSLISLILLVIGLKLAGVTFASLKTKQPGIQWARAIAHFLGQWSWMTALIMIPLVELFALEFTTPLWVAVLAPFVLGEKLTPVRIAAAVLGFIGAMIIIRPGSASLNLGSALAILCAFLFAINLIGTKYLTRSDGPLTILLFMTVNHTCLAFILGFPGLKLPGDWTTTGWLLALGTASLAAHFALARAIFYADAIVVAPMDFMRLPLIALIGVAFYNEALQPIVILGTAVVLAGNVLNLWGERQAAVARAAARGG